MKRAALYIRVSTEEQARHGFSLNEQRHTLEGYAARHGFAIADVYADEGVSARKGLRNRHELQRLLADIRAGLIDVILFIKLDRWFRNIRDYYKVQDILEQYHVTWIATQEDYNTATSAGRLNLNIRLSIAQNESDQTGERVKFVYDGKRRRREAVAGRVTFGYKVENNKYVIDEPRAAIVRDIFSRYLFCQSITETQRYIATKVGHNIGHDKMVYLLRNERYLGRFFDIDDYAPPIVDRDIFDKVQKILAIGRRGETPRRANSPYLFSGLVFCPSCHTRLAGNRAGGNGKGKKYYMCRKHYRDFVCDFSRLVSETTLERYLVTNLERQINQYRHHLEVRRANAHSDLVGINNRIASARARLSRLKDLYVSGFIDRATYEQDFATDNGELTRAMAEKRAADNPGNLPRRLSNIIEQGFSALYNKLSPEGRKTFWKSIVYKLELTKVEPVDPNHKKSPLAIECKIIFL